MDCKYETKNGRCGLKGTMGYKRKCYTEECCKCFEKYTLKDLVQVVRCSKQNSLDAQEKLASCK